MPSLNRAIAPAPPPSQAAPADGRVLFVYWGRRGALSWMAVELAESLRAARTGDLLSYAPGNELAGRLSSFAPATLPFPTFASAAGAFTGIPRFRRDAGLLLEGLRREGFGAVVVLMPHLWTPLLAPIVRRAGLRHLVVVHDAVGHPGDHTGLATRWLLRETRAADVVVTLSNAVAARLVAGGQVPRKRIVVEPHPLLAYPRVARLPGPHPLRVLFLGRIMAYKGLPLLVDAIALLRARGVPVELGVVGEGDLNGLGPRLAALGARIENRWIDHAEIGGVLSRYDVVALPYVEASQSGVALTAFGGGMPVVGTPVGGLRKQIRHGIDGLLADAATPAAFADALARLATDPPLLARLTAGAADHPGRSVASFAARLKELALQR
ncbi:MAG: glycosyltransferase family 4 protein [Bauldia sp.]|nr:glycosyltransferase family 4 protein [Bauldia sp.]MCW5718639.1 glycosyltransferase family 4 protein [Bauldia sp.]